ncbi:hypothetical protein Mal15_28560 [Stieleria maiorica]|uniref:Uncharacterized protein n=2 Tax=Stieleria maiorica TaxID=2795974 RepID=A0A5B9MFK5_9BACT|nr:hypothetical protein Mal15_28560 [Stieleria maiorica]
MKMSEQFAGAYLKAADLPHPRVLTIQSVTQTTMPEGDNKPVMRFVGEQQQLVLNKTNAFTCVELFGDETTAWHGQPIELYATTTNFSGRMVPCIRVRAPQQAAAASSVVPPPSPAAPQGAPLPVPQPTPTAVQPQPMQQPPIQAPAADYPVDA